MKKEDLTKLLADKKEQLNRAQAMFHQIAGQVGILEDLLKKMEADEKGEAPK